MVNWLFKYQCTLIPVPPRPWYKKKNKIRVKYSTYLNISTASTQHVREIRKLHLLLLPDPDTLLLPWFLLPSRGLPDSSGCSTSAQNFCTYRCCGCSHMDSIKTALPNRPAQVSPLLQSIISAGYCRLVSKTMLMLFLNILLTDITL